jgi:alpha-N-arabinofuranosidase
VAFFYEWNAWYRATTGDAVDGHQQEAPHQWEELYNLEDALLVGGIMNSLTPTEFPHNAVSPVA